MVFLESGIQVHSVDVCLAYSHEHCSVVPGRGLGAKAPEMHSSGWDTAT